MARYLTEQQTSKRMTVSRSALRKWRREGVGPPYIKLGRIVRYPRTELEKWLKSRLRLMSSWRVRPVADFTPIHNDPKGETKMIFKKTNNYELPEEGSHLAVLADIDDRGEQQTPWGLRKQVRFKWLLEQKGKEGRELSVIATFNNSLNENSSLVEAITSITGAPPGDEFDGDTLIGTNSRLAVKHKTKKDGNIFPKIVAILRPAKGDPVLRVPGWFKRVGSGDKNPPAAATPSGAAPQPAPKPSTPALSSDGNRNDHLESPPDPPDSDPRDYDDEAANFPPGEHAA